MKDELNEEMAKENQYQFRKSTQRTAILLGRTRTGKSTLTEMLQDPSHVPEMGSLFSVTKDIKIYQLTTTHSDKNYSLTIIDSPGLYESMRNDGRPRTNKEIKKLIDQCITKDVTRIHTFAFVFSSEGGINIQDIQSMIYIKRHYPKLTNFFILIITHCEEKNEQERHRFSEEFFQHPDVIKHGLKELFGLGVFFTGCLRPQLQNDPNIRSAKNQAANILDMRKKLLEFLISREETFNIHFMSPTNSLFENIYEFFSWRKVIVIIFAFVVLMFAVIFGRRDVSRSSQKDDW